MRPFAGQVCIIACGRTLLSSQTRMRRPLGTQSIIPTQVSEQSIMCFAMNVWSAFSCCGLSQLEISRVSWKWGLLLGGRVP